MRWRMRIVPILWRLAWRCSLPRVRRPPFPRHHHRYLHCVLFFEMLQEAAWNSWMSSAPANRPRIVPGSGCIRCWPRSCQQDQSCLYSKHPTNLKNRQFMHLLPLTSRNHILQHSKLFVHLGSASPLDQTVCSLPCDLPASGCCAIAVLLPFTTILSGALRLPSPCFSSSASGSFLFCAWLHLNDLAGPGRRRRQSKVIFCDYRTSILPLSRRLSRGWRCWSVR